VAYSTLEDFFGDIVGKARRGQGMSVADLARQAGLTPADIERVESYDLVPEDVRIRALADTLKLSADKLVSIARNWFPAHGNDSFEDTHLSVTRLEVRVGRMEANCYLLRCKQTGKGAIVDPGAEARRILDAVDQHQARVSHILVTHGHGDHTGALQEIRQATGASVCCGEGDIPLLGETGRLVDEKVTDDWGAHVGEIAVEAVGLPGHTPGGTGYGANGIFFSGDALFAGSLGGARGAGYRQQIEEIERVLLSRNSAVSIFPGHGPVTTVGEERTHNPFFL